ncbi:hypothetical protein E2C01_005649 [Portunus trituberculatus]|uniref:Transmembrane protein n=1 Tax=Portunus trituberculatus TaxID=210409 RepID=A0A5B7CT94_PORTR|nr:hypothetical protein [Portunus trituberculatus]
MEAKVEFGDVSGRWRRCRSRSELGQDPHAGSLWSAATVGLGLTGGEAKLMAVKVVVVAVVVVVVVVVVGICMEVWNDRRGGCAKQ